MDNFMILAKVASFLTFDEITKKLSKVSNLDCNFYKALNLEILKSGHKVDCFILE